MSLSDKLDIIQIDQGKKYVLIVPTQKDAEELKKVWAKFMEENGQAIFIFGSGVALVSVDQVKGYKLFEES